MPEMETKSNERQKQNLYENIVIYARPKNTKYFFAGVYFLPSLVKRVDFFPNTKWYEFGTLFTPEQDTIHY